MPKITVTNVPNDMTHETLVSRICDRDGELKNDPFFSDKIMNN